ncbi:hypothetical protein CPB84DRAFT_1750194 [Gymnopilus junonius]|uniref:Uncharacterized protein n=1 Tax=Gymnopilus junonius TaxID=109634 RepID=A0A9P5TJL2_GYMJU|nr:hypothetical protein CPB84DRAFT_1750194 [Gymnopilus junonius]
MSLQSMSLMLNITELTLQKILINKDVIHMITHLPELHTLIIKCCQVIINDPIPNALASKLSLLQLEFLSVTGTWGESLCTFVKHLSFRSLMKLRTGILELLEKLVEAPSIISLEINHFLSNDTWQELQPILEATPTLRTFHLSPICRLGPPFKLNPQALPHLEDVESPLPALQGLLPGRCIHSIGIKSYYHLTSSDVKIIK